MKTSEGVVLGVEKKLVSKLMEPSKSEKLVEVSCRVLNEVVKAINHISKASITIKFRRCIRH